MVEEISDTGLNNSQQSILDTFKKSAGKNVEQIFSEYVLVYDETMLNGPGNEVHRMFNAESGDHVFTISTAERDALLSFGWEYEGVAFIAIEEGKKVYRLANPGGMHMFTTNAKERDTLVKAGWIYEGVGFKAN